MSKHHHHNCKKSCPQLPGTVARIKLPPGTLINLLNLVEIDSPSGVCLIIRIPRLAGNAISNSTLLTKAVEAAGGSIKFAKE